MAQDLFADQIPLMRPWLGEEEVQAIREVVLSGWVSQGPKVAQFEREVANLVGAKHAVATNAATTALHLTMQVMGVQPGDEVILPAFTCMANANSVIIAGAVPRFADIERDTYNLDPDDLPRRIGPKTRAIMMVDQIGMPADLDRIRPIAECRGLALLGDSATALGAQYKGRYVGGHGVPACYSFHPRKMITTGEGGMIVTDNEAWAESARVLRSTGASDSDLKRHEAKGAIFQQYFVSGYNYRMTDMQAAMGIVQLGKLAAMLEQRTAQARLYGELLSDIDEVAPPFVPDYAKPAFSSYCVRVRPSCRVTADEIVRGLAARNISGRRGIQPLYLEPYFKQRMAGLSLPETEAAARETFFLPIFPGLTETQQRAVVDAIKQSLTR
jgi:perosamine synthetase